MSFWCVGDGKYAKSPGAVWLVGIFYKKGETMKRITSFTVDHRKLKKGMYISRVDFGDIVTYDIRMKLPNKGDYLSSGGAHTIEHLFATYARNSDFSQNVVYVGPMGCLTGFYLIVKGMSHEDALNLVRASMAFVRDYDEIIPGSLEEECGNYLLHDRAEARAVAVDMEAILENWTSEKMVYSALLE